MGVVDYSTLMYQVYIPSQRRAVDTCNVIFNEHSASRPPTNDSSPAFIYTPLSNEDNEGLSQQHPAAPHTMHNGHAQPNVPGTSVDDPRESSTAADAAAPAPDDEDTPTPAPPSEIITPAPTNAPTMIIGAAHGQSVPSKQVDWAATSSAKHRGDVVATTHLGCSIHQPTHFANQPPPKGTPGVSTELHLLSTPLNLTATHVLHIKQQLQHMDTALHLVQNTTTVPRTF